MSESLDTIDLSLLGIGQEGKIDISQVKTAYINPGEQSPAHIRIYNDSGSTLRIRSDTGTIQDYVPAGAWLTYPIDHSVQAINFTVIGMIPNAPIQLLMPTYFAPGEEVPATPQLGNSPVGIGNTVPINASGTSVIDDGDVADTEFIEASVGGVKHRSDTNSGDIMLLKDTTSGNQPMIILRDLKAAGKSYSIYLMTDGSLLFQETVGGAFVFQIHPDGSLGLANFNAALDGGGSLIINNLTSVGTSSLDNGAITTDGAGHITSTATAGAGANSLWKIAPSDDASLRMSWRATGSELVLHEDTLNTRCASFFMGLGGLKLSGLGNRVAAWSFFTGNATGTYSHGLGVIPTVILAMQNVVGSQTMGWDSATSSTVHITSFSGASFSALALSMA